MTHREIPLTRGKVAIVDAEDYERMAEFGWHAAKGGKYAGRGIRENGKYRTEYMHRVILGAPTGMHVDHINGDGLDNRRSNLRLATARENRYNKGAYANNKSGHKGVSWFEQKGQWRAQIRYAGEQVHLGLYDGKYAAALAYDDAARILFGDFAWLNYPDVTIEQALAEYYRMSGTGTKV